MRGSNYNWFGWPQKMEERHSVFFCGQVLSQKCSEQSPQQLTHKTERKKTERVFLFGEIHVGLVLWLLCSTVKHLFKVRTRWPSPFIEYLDQRWHEQRCMWQLKVSRKTSWNDSGSEDPLGPSGGLLPSEVLWWMDNTSGRLNSNIWSLKCALLLLYVPPPTLLVWLLFGCLGDFFPLDSKPPTGLFGSTGDGFAGWCRPPLSLRS